MPYPPAQTLYCDSFSLRATSDNSHEGGTFKDREAPERGVCEDTDDNDCLGIAGEETEEAAGKPRDLQLRAFRAEGMPMRLGVE